MGDSGRLTRARRVVAPLIPVLRRGCQVHTKVTHTPTAGHGRDHSGGLGDVVLYALVSSGVDARVVVREPPGSHGSASSPEATAGSVTPRNVG